MKNNLGQRYGAFKALGFDDYFSYLLAGRLTKSVQKYNKVHHVWPL